MGGAWSNEDWFCPQRVERLQAETESKKTSFPSSGQAVKVKAGTPRVNHQLTDRVHMD